MTRKYRLYIYRYIYTHTPTSNETRPLQVYEQTHGRLDAFLEANGETFVLQSESARGTTEVLLMAQDDDDVGKDSGNGSSRNGRDKGAEGGEFDRYFTVSMFGVLLSLCV